MNKGLLKKLLSDYEPLDENELDFKNRMIQLLENELNCFSRDLLSGHFTASAFIVNQHKTKIVLLMHSKLKMWVQPGGHCDGDSDVAKVSMKEAFEETGLLKLEFLSNEIFDIDIHSIPERKGTPKHDHYDIRFLIMADENVPFLISDESTDIKWVPLMEIENYNVDQSILRMAKKLKDPILKF